MLTKAKLTKNPHWLAGKNVFTSQLKHCKGYTPVTDCDYPLSTNYARVCKEYKKLLTYIDYLSPPEQLWARDKLTWDVKTNIHLRLPPPRDVPDFRDWLSLLKSDFQREKSHDSSVSIANAEQLHHYCVKRLQHYFERETQIETLLFQTAQSKARFQKKLGNPNTRTGGNTPFTPQSTW